MPLFFFVDLHIIHYISKVNINYATEMVNFMCQLDQAMGCPDIWFNIILGMSGRVFLDEMNI